MYPKWGSLARALVDLEDAKDIVTSHTKVVHELNLKLHEDWSEMTAAHLEASHWTRTIFAAQSVLEGFGGERMGDHVVGGSYIQAMILHPHGTLRLGWALLGAFLLAWDIIFIPMQFFDLGELQTFLDRCFFLVCGYWIADVLLSFITGHDRGGMMEMRPKAILNNYLKTWFLLDASLVSIDISLIVFSLTMTEIVAKDAVMAARLTRVLRLLRLLRLLRIRKVRQIADVLYSRFHTDASILVLTIVRGVFLILIVNHYIACSWYGIGLMAVDGVSWLDTFDTRFYPRYIASLHWSLAQFGPATSNVSGQNYVERVFAIAVIIFSLGAFSSFIGSVANSVNQLRVLKEELLRDETKARNFLTERQVSKEVWYRIHLFYKTHTHDQMRLLTESDIKAFQHLPESLLIKLHEEIYMPSLLLARWLPDDAENIDAALLGSFCHLALSERSVRPHSDVWVDGADCSNVIWVHSGYTFYHSVLLPEHGARLVEGQWLCQLALWASWRHRGQLVTESQSHFIVISCEKILRIAAQVGGPVTHHMRTVGVLLLGEAEKEDARGIMVTDTWPETDILSAVSTRAARWLKKKRSSCCQRALTITPELGA